MSVVEEMTVIEIIRLTMDKDYREGEWYQSLSEKDRILADKIRTGFYDGVGIGMTEYMEDKKEK